MNSTRNRLVLAGCLLLALLISAQQGFAQYNLVSLYDQHWNLAGSKLIPSKLGMDDSRLQVLLPGQFAYAGNSAVPLQMASRINTVSAKRVAERLNFRTHAGVGQEQEYLGIAYKHIGYNGSEKYSIGLNVYDRMGVSSSFPRDFGQLLLLGNAAFAGQTVDIEKLELSAWHLRDYGFAFVKVINTPYFNRLFQLRIGARAKYIQGFAAAYLPATDGKISTEGSGQYIDFQTNYQYYTAGVQGWSMGNRNPAVNGQGFGGDFSITGNFANLIKGSISVVDIGSVTFNNKTTRYDRTEGFRYEGQVSGNLLGGANGQFDTLLTTSLRGTQTKEVDFSMQLPTRIIMQAEFSIDHDPGRKGNLEYKKKKFNKKYDKHTLFLTYIQGVNRMPGNTVRPLVSAAYSYSWGYVLSMGGNISYGGLNRVGMGAFASARLGPIRIGAGSSNFLGAVFSGWATGADYSINAAFAF